MKNFFAEAFKPLVFRGALRVALIVGVILNIINQWQSIFRGFNSKLGGPNLLKFGSRKFKDMLVEIHTKPFAEQKQILKDKILEWRGNYNQIDDMLVIGFRLR